MLVFSDFFYFRFLLYSWFFSVDFLFNSFTSYRSICSDVNWCKMKEALYLKRQFTRNYKGCWLLKWEHVLYRCPFGNVSNIILVWDIHLFLTSQSCLTSDSCIVVSNNVSFFLVFCFCFTFFVIFNAIEVRSISSHHFLLLLILLTLAPLYKL